MSIFLAVVLFLGGAYALLMLVYLAGWLLQKSFSIPEDFAPATMVSIIIPARNEEANIGDCIRSILAQEYPSTLFEVIVVDDFSEDGTAAVVQAFSKEHLVKLVALSEVVTDRASVTAFKKTALEAGIAQSRGSLIITTDADCVAGPQWLHCMVAAYQSSQAKVIIAPVDFTSNGSLVETFQSLDFRTMQGITGATHRLKLGHMANGANLAFTKEAYHAVNGYDGTKHVASGDDYLLLVKMAGRFPKGICYLKNKQAIMHTAPQPTWKALLNQRIRWASKSGKYKDDKLTAILLLVYLFNVSLIALLVAGAFNVLYWKVLMGMMAMKIALEILFLLPVSGFFNKRRTLLIFPFLQPLHILYIGLAGFLGFVGKYEWKGRSLK